MNTINMDRLDITDIGNENHQKKEELSNPPASLAYKISADGEWIDA